MRYIRGMQHHRIMLVGNGPNRLVDFGCSVAWETALKKLEETLQVRESGDKISFQERMRRLSATSIEKTGVSVTQTDAFQDWLKNVAALPPTGVHRLLACFQPYLDAILTPNYDYAIEKAFRLNPAPPRQRTTENFNRKRGRKLPVYHIHGEAYVPQSIVMFPDEYNRHREELQQAVRKGEKTWLQLFLTNEVHICGFSYADPEVEKIITYALEERRKHLRRMSNFSSRCGEIYFYDMVEYIDSERQRRLEEAGVRYVPVLLNPNKIGIPTRYRDAWLQTIAEIQLRIMREYLWTETVETTPRCLINQYHGQVSRRMPLSTAFSTHYKFRRCFRMKISREKLSTAAGKMLPWLFYCRREDASIGLYRAESEVLFERLFRTHAAFADWAKVDVLLDPSENPVVFVPEPYADGVEKEVVCSLTSLCIDDFNQEFDRIREALGLSVDDTAEETPEVASSGS